MHIAIISHEYPPQAHGGIGTFTADLAEGLVQAGQEVTVFAVAPYPNRMPGTPTREDSLKRGVRIIRLCLRSPEWMRWRPGTIWQRLRLLKVLREEHRLKPFDVLECADAWGWLPLAKVPGVPMITRLHGAMFFFDKVMSRMTGDPLTHWLEQKSLARTDYVVGVSNYVAKDEMAMSRIPNAPVHVIYNAVDTNYFTPSPAPKIEEGLIVFVNSVQYRKGVYELCQAMNILAPQFPKARLAMIGRIDNRPKTDKPISDDLIESVKPEFRDRVNFLGWLKTRDEVLEYLRKAHVCCYPSRLECFGIAPAEAMSVGRPTVYSSWGPGAEVIEHGVSGLLCNPEDPKDIADKIKMVFEDRALAEKLGQEARKRVVKLFDRSDWIKRNVEFYESCVKKAGRASRK